MTVNVMRTHNAVQRNGRHAPGWCILRWPGLVTWPGAPRTGSYTIIRTISLWNWRNCFLCLHNLPNVCNYQTCSLNYTHTKQMPSSSWKLLYDTWPLLEHSVSQVTSYLYLRPWISNSQTQLNWAISLVLQNNYFELLALTCEGMYGLTYTHLITEGVRLLHMHTHACIAATISASLSSWSPALISSRSCFSFLQHKMIIVLFKMFSRRFFANKKLIITLRTWKFGDVT